MSGDLIRLLAREVAILFAPFSEIREDPASLDDLLLDVGAMTPGESRQALVAGATALADIQVQLDALAQQSSVSATTIASLLEITRAAFTVVRELENVSGAPPWFKGLGGDLVELLVAAYLRGPHPLAGSVAALLTLVEPAPDAEPTAPVVQNGELVRAVRRLDRIHFDRLGRLLRDPLTTLKAAYGDTLATQADAQRMAAKLFPRVVRVLRELGVPCRYGFTPGDEERLGDTAPLVQQALIVYADDLLAGAAAEAGAVFYLSSVERGDLGLVVSPFGTLTFTRELDRWLISMSVTAGVDVAAYGRHGVTLLAGPGTTEVIGSFIAELRAPEDNAEGGFVVGAPDGTRLEVGGTRFSIDTSLTDTDQELALAWELSSAALVVGGGDADGFIRKILPANGVRADFDLGLAWSSERGLTLRGSAGLEATWPVGRSVGTLTVSRVSFGLRPADDLVETEASATIDLHIGPLAATVDRIGMAAGLTFPEADGNLGAADLSIRFKPPSGVGLVIDTAGVTGGGYLFFDPEKHEYAGVLQLELAETIALTAIGLLTTRLPDGSQGYSLLISITAQGFQPIQLGLGFRLSGIGGLIGVNRTVAVDVLRAGLKKGSLDSVLFPADPVRNAAQIVTQIRTVFPPAEGRFIFGPMVVIDWGTPPVVTMDLAVILEVPSPVRLIVLGQIRAALPRAGKAVIQLKMDVLGVLEIDQGELAIDAVLYDSRMLTFAVTGDMALRARWVTDPTFILAAGGLNPHFSPPAGFPTLQRLAISLATGDNPRLRLEAYLALTSNTAQIGARLDLRVAAAGFSIEGYLQFDALFQFAPFHFIVEIGAGVTLKWKGRTLVGVQLALTLEGPSPWHAAGKATFKIWIFSKSVSFDKTFGTAERPAALPPADPLPELVAALADRRSWSGGVPTGSRGLVSVRDTASPDLRVHPLGQLTVRQRVVPLEIQITRFGHTAPAGERRFRITAVHLGGQRTATQSVTDYFAPGQFLDLTEAQRLTRPSFELLPSGIALTADAVQFGGQDAAGLMATADLEYETGPPASADRRATPVPTAPLSAEALRVAAAVGAAAHAAAHRPGRGKYRGQPRDLTPQPPTYVVAHATDLAPADEVAGTDAAGTSYTAAAHALATHLAAHPDQRGRLKIVAPHELSRAA